MINNQKEKDSNYCTMWRKLIQLNIQSVDDVVEIQMSQQRRREAFGAELSVGLLKDIFLLL